MRRLISLFLSLILLFNLAGTSLAETEATASDSLDDENLDFSSLDDPAFLQYMEDSVYSNLESEFSDAEATYEIDDVNVVFISREYLEETAYNSKTNIFFGYSLAQLNEAFQGEKYVFTLSDQGDTVVQEFVEIPNDTFNRVIKNVLIGTGVILICVTVSVLTAGTATTAMAAGALSTTTKLHLIFAASAKTATAFASKGALFSGVTSLVVRGFETGWDMDAMTESALVASSEAFKWGAITGSIVGGSNEAFKIHRISKGTVSFQEAEHVAEAHYGGRKQVTYLNGVEVPYGTPGAVRPDIVVGNEAIEVKRYDLIHNLNGLIANLKSEISQRIIHLPQGMTQRVVLNVDGRGYTAAFVQRAVSQLQAALGDLYANIPIDIMGEML